MEWYTIVSSIVTIILGGGWFVYYRANKMKAYGEAWESQQRVYQNTIADLEKSCEFIRNDRDLLRKENKNLFKLGELQKEVDEIKKDYLLSVFQEHAQKYNYESNEHKIIREIAEELGLSILLIGDKNNRI